MITINTQQNHFILYKTHISEISNLILINDFSEKELALDVIIRSEPNYYIIEITEANDLRKFEGSNTLTVYDQSGELKYKENVRYDIR
jgi:hypothetical protein